MPTNSFTTSTNHHLRRQQILIPKELFPCQNVTKSSMINDKETKLVVTNSFRRPVKLPLRKHHSFSFQPSQTVAGAVIKPDSYGQVPPKERYKNQGPLIFKPFSEKSAFKPITPAPKSPNKKLASDDNDQPLDDQCEMPRICGTSLKRHISNVETYTTNSRKLHYADLEPLHCSGATKTSNRNPKPSANYFSKNISNDNDKNNNSFAQSTDDSETNGDGIENHSETNKKAGRLAQQSKKENAYATQYATLKFDEVNI